MTGEGQIDQCNEFGFYSMGKALKVLTQGTNLN
jgi:hypothetical protein